jgi:feruloyl esterase
MTAGRFDSVHSGATNARMASGSTDAGLPSSQDGASWAGNEQLLRNFAHLSIHEMTVVGKASHEQFYGTPAKYAHWNGCSTGGRQGYMDAQRCSEDCRARLSSKLISNYL